MSATINHTPEPWEAVPTVHTHRKLLFGRAKNRAQTRALFLLAPPARPPRFAPRLP